MKSPLGTDNKFRRVLIVIAIVLLAVIGVLLLQFRPGVLVTVENSGTTAMRSVVLYVTGASYPLGDISPGTSTTARVRPTGESGLEVAFTDADGKLQRLDAGGYFESGYRGTIRISIKDGTIEKNAQEIKLW